ncbi:MAG: hypothetical protein Q9175_008248 [Cornicularia normoerica]
MPTMVRDDGPTVSDYLGKVRKRHALCAMLRSSSCDPNPIHGKESMLCLSTFHRESLPNLKTSNDYVLRVWISGAGMLTLLILPLLLSRYMAVSALALPPMLTNLTTDWTLPNLNSNSEAHCAQDPPERPPLPLSPDCIRAIHLLPQSPYIGTFHIGGAPSLWRLPHSEGYDTCTVLVILNEDFDLEMGSWNDVRNAALNLLLFCRLPFEQGGQQRTGGWIAAGAENGLVIELRRSRLGG